MPQEAKNINCHRSEKLMMQSQHLFNLKSALHLSIEDDMYVELLKVRLWNDLIHFPYSHSFQTDTKIFWPALNPSLGFKTCTQKSNKVRSKQSTYCSMAEEFTITTIAVFPTIRPAIIRWWRTLIDRWSVAWATISTAPYTWWGTRGDIKAQAVKVCNKKRSHPN